MTDIFIAPMTPEIQLHLYSAKWILISMLPAVLTALLLRWALTGRFRQQVDPIVLGAFAVVTAVIAISIYFTHDIDLWKGLTLILGVLALVFGKSTRSSRRRGRRHRY